jgi:hypothetical protein
MRAATVWLGLSVAMTGGCGGRSQGQGSPRDVEPSGVAGTSAGPVSDPCVCQLGQRCAEGCYCSQLLCDGVCVDAQVESTNCGVCGRTCNACEAGRCVDVLAKDLHAPNALALGPSDVYWTTSLGVMRVSKSGGAASVIVPASEGAGARAIAVDDDYVYWSGSFDQKLMRAAIAAPTPEVFADTRSPTSSYINAIVVDQAAIYWTDWQNGQVLTLPKSGGVPRVLTDAARRPGALAVDATHVYWTEDLADGQGAVVSMPLAGGTPLTLASGQSAPRGIAINATHVYWTATWDKTLSRVLLAGGALEIVANAEVYPSHVALDDKFAYWVGGYAVQKVRLQGGETEQEPGDDFVNDLAVDATSVYFVQDGEGGSFTNGTLVKVTPK